MADDDLDIEQAHRPRGMWSGTISFGLVSVPVSLYPAVREERIRLRMLGPGGTPLSRRYYCPAEGVEVHPEHLIRGYEVEKGTFITVTEEELESLEPEKSRDIDLQQFVRLDELDPVYFERAYFLVPDSGSTKAYRLLAGAMEKSQRAGIARFVMRDKEYLIAIIAENGILRAETMRFFDEVRSPEDIDLPEPAKAKKEQRDAFAKAIEKLSRENLDPEEMADAQMERLQKIIERKRKKKEDLVEVETAADQAHGEEEEEPVDLIEVLRASLAGRANGRGGLRGAQSSPGGDRHRRAGRGERTSQPSSTREESLDDMSRNELYERAQELDIPGRGSMNKAQLKRALRRRD